MTGTELNINGILNYTDLNYTDLNNPNLNETVLNHPEIPNILGWLDRNIIYSEEREDDWEKFARRIGFSNADVGDINFSVRWKTSPTAYILKNYRETSRCSLKQLIKTMDHIGYFNEFSRTKDLFMSLVKHWCKNRNLPQIDQICLDPIMNHEIGKTILLESEIVTIFMTKFDKDRPYRINFGRELGYGTQTIRRMERRISRNFSPAKKTFKLWKEIKAQSKVQNKLQAFDCINFINAYLEAMGGKQNANHLIAIIYNTDKLPDSIKYVLYKCIRRDYRHLGNYPLLKMEKPKDPTDSKDTIDSKVKVPSVYPNLNQPNPLECPICMDGQKNVLFLPCKHVSTCEKCSEKVSTCPVCRKMIERKMKIHLS